MPEWTLSVGELNEYVRLKLAGDPMLRGVSVRGEISGFKRHVSGHLYFSLKDDQARVACAMFRSQAFRLDFTPEDGQQVVVTGTAGLYAVSGSYQLYVDDMRREGAGDLFLRFEKLKKKLSEEGLFDPSIKKPLPLHPKVIGVVTSRSGAAFHDIVRVARARNPRVEIILSPCAVQGADAGADIARALKRLWADGRADVILVGRGGGSMEDLWAFNEEAVARAIYACPVPVISCVGHETDFTITDFAADARAATPSNAAELAVGDAGAAKKALALMAGRLTGALTAAQKQRRTRLRACGRSPYLQMPERMLTRQPRNALALALTRLRAAYAAAETARRIRLARAADMLAAMDPGRVLKRGYACVRGENGVISDARGLKAGEKIEIEMRDARADAVVCGISEKEDA